MSQVKKYDIFISYRREGSKNIARLLKTELGLRGYHAFLDFDELKDGRFDKRIMDAIDAAPVFMFILSEHALDRCVDENDWVRKEIEYAMETERHIVPINPDKSFSDFPEYVPKSLKDGLGLHHFSQLLLDDLFNQTMDKLVVERLEPILGKRNRYQMSTIGATIHLSTDANCEVYRYGKHECNVVTGEDKIVYLKKGKHKFEFISIDNEKDKYSIVFSVEDIDMEDMLEIQFQPIIEKREVEERTRREVEEKACIEETNKQDNESLQDDAVQKIYNEDNAVITSFETLLEKRYPNKDTSKILKGVMYGSVLGPLGAVAGGLIASSDKATNAISRVVGSITYHKTENKQEEFVVNDVSFKMITIQGGTFTMGATSEQGSDADDDEKPKHSVTLSDYMIGETVVTQALWEAVMGSNPSKFKGSQIPIEEVSWDDCQMFIKKLNQLTDMQFRLPTEAEWEYAARGGQKSQGYKYAGSNILDNVAYYQDYTDWATHPVKQKKSNELGLYDMSGNVWEWCQDWYGDYNSSVQTNPIGPSSGRFRVLRGGSWRNLATSCRVANRNYSSPDYHNSGLGLRLALSIVYLKKF